MISGQCLQAHFPVDMLQTGAGSALSQGIQLNIHFFFAKTDHMYMNKNMNITSYNGIPNS